jgi:hypothetical protein
MTRFTQGGQPMRIRPMAVASIVFVALVVSAAPRLLAITYGFVDTNAAYGNTGAFIVKSRSTGAIFPICSGSLIAPGVFLTASHCTAFYEQDLADRYTAHVSFDGTIPFGDLTSRRTKLVAVNQVVTNPAYHPAQNDSGDIGLLIVDARATRDITPATLPPAGLLDRLVATGAFDGAPVINAGYGLQNRVVGGGVPFYQDANPVPRMFSFSSFDALNPGYIRYSQNPATGNGGACFGDSGGPQFFDHGGTRYQISITITGDAVCRATNVSYRLDAEGARSFLAPYVALP